jgi:hypothetical protein
VNNDKTKILLVCEDAQPTLDAAAGTIQNAINPSHEIKRRLASEVSIQEVLAADCYLFGVTKADSHAWKELRRVFQGINLAGRRAAYFTGDRSEAALLRKAFRDAELDAYEQDLYLNGAYDCSAWVRAVLSKV